MIVCWGGSGEGPCPEPDQGPAGHPVAGAVDAGGLCSQGGSAAAVLSGESDRFG